MKVENGNFKFFYKNIEYEVKGDAEIQKFVFNISKTTIYDDYGAPLHRRMEEFIKNLQEDGIYENIRYWIGDKHPELLI